VLDSEFFLPLRIILAIDLLDLADEAPPPMDIFGHTVTADFVFSLFSHSVVSALLTPPVLVLTDSIGSSSLSDSTIFLTGSSACLMEKPALPSVRLSACCSVTLQSDSFVSSPPDDSSSAPFSDEEDLSKGDVPCELFFSQGKLLVSLLNVGSLLDSVRAKLAICDARGLLLKALESKSTLRGLVRDTEDIGEAPSLLPSRIRGGGGTGVELFDAEKGDL